MFEPIGSAAIPEVAAGANPVVPGSNDPPGPGLAAVLAGVDPTALSGDALAEVIAGCERMVSWAQARQLAAITVLGTRMGKLVGSLPAGPGFAVDAAELTVAEVAITLTVSEARRGIGWRWPAPFRSSHRPRPRSRSGRSTSAGCGR